MTEVMMSNGMAKLEQVRNALEVFNKKHEFKPGDVVQWKPGMRNTCGFPEYGEPALVAAVHADPVYASNETGGSPYFNEPLDLMLAHIDGDDEFILYHYDSRRFEPYKPGKE